MLEAKYLKYTLRFKETARTSRAVMTEKETYFIKLLDTEHPDICGIGEVALFRGLGADDTEWFENALIESCRDINRIEPGAIQSSAIRFGLETAISDLQNGGTRRPFSKGDDWAIRINGLVWMDGKGAMAKSASQKIEAGFSCIKLKIGGISFDDEISILKSIRQRYSPEDIEIRLDANGAFSPEEALHKLEELSIYGIHSIEQPIKPHNPAEMAQICRESPIAIALDEELIGITPDNEKKEMLSFINPSYIILKPSLCGGFKEADKWIDCAEELSIGWWATSALESDIGLNAIARWLSLKDTSMPQGLGTGMLYTNNIASPLSMNGDMLSTDTKKGWDLTLLKF